MVMSDKMGLELLALAVDCILVLRSEGIAKISIVTKSLYAGTWQSLWNFIPWPVSRNFTTLERPCLLWVAGKPMDKHHAAYHQSYFVAKTAHLLFKLVVKPSLSQS